MMRNDAATDREGLGSSTDGSTSCGTASPRTIEDGIHNSITGDRLPPSSEQPRISECNRDNAVSQTGWGAVLLGFAIFGLLWILDTPYREFYVPSSADIPALADGLLLAPGAHWEDWFTRGYSNFWDVYPEWPLGSTGFTRPAFQFVIYLAHFALGKNWELYRIISCFAAAGVGAAAFLIARTALGLRTGLSLLAAALVVLSPPVLQSWLISLANAHEPLTTLLVACAFLAAVARRDFLCLMLLFVALLTKENAVWAPAAAAITIMLRPKPGEPLRRRAIAAAAMFLPIVMWLGLRFAFFGGIGGTYATAGYTPLGDFLALSFKKLKYLDSSFRIPISPTGFRPRLESYHRHLRTHVKPGNKRLERDF